MRTPETMPLQTYQSGGPLETGWNPTRGRLGLVLGLNGCTADSKTPDTTQFIACLNLPLTYTIFYSAEQHKIRHLRERKNGGWAIMVLEKVLVIPFRGR